jgi:hypothetical protein
MPSRLALSAPLLVVLVTTGLVTALAAAPAAADSLLILKSHADALQLKEESQPARDTEVRLWVAGDKVRRDEGDSSMILRLDRNKLYLVHHPDKTYNELPLPSDFARYMGKEKADLALTWVQKMRLTVKMTPGSETKKVGSWTARRTQMDITSAMGMKIATTLWLSKDVPSYPVLNKLTAALAALQPGASDWSDKLEKLDGFPVLKEDDVDALGAHFRTREELVKVETKDAPAGLYDPPAGYTAEPFDPMASTGG